ncbi:MAG: ABC transporter permease [Cyanobacteriota bacterium]|nr:ABC transporter permease [Cyanobacteriota bacterium]
MTSKAISARDRFNGLTSAIDSETLLYILKRFLQALLTLLLVSALSFLIIQLAPGDYLDGLRQNPEISPERLQELAEEFGLDNQPPQGFTIPWLTWVARGYWKWLSNVITELNFGESFVYSRSVASLLSERIFNTLLLAISSIILTWAIAIPLGIIGAVRQNRLSDRVLRVLSYMGQGFPSFITALLLLILAQNLSPLVPVGGMTSVNHNNFSPLGKVLDIGWHMILPTIALSITSFAGLQRLMRGELLDVLRQDYIQTARAKGLPENKVIYIHALRNAINPLITILGFEFAGLLSGAFIAEFFFNWPGLGRLILDAVRRQDLYLVMGSLVMGAAMLILGNLLADLLLKAVDPRIKLENLK